MKPAITRWTALSAGSQHGELLTPVAWNCRRDIRYFAGTDLAGRVPTGLALQCRRRAITGRRASRTLGAGRWAGPGLEGDGDMPEYAAAITFPQKSTAYEALSKLSSASGGFEIRSAAIVERDKDGHLHVPEGGDAEAALGAAEVTLDAHVAHHRPADERDLAAVRFRRVEHLLHPVHVRGKARDDDPPGRLAEDVVEHGTDLTFRRDEPRHFGVRRAKQLLPDHLGSYESKRLIGNVVFREDRRTFRQAILYNPKQFSQALPCLGRDRYAFAERKPIGIACDGWKEKPLIV